MALNTAACRIPCAQHTQILSGTWIYKKFEKHSWHSAHTYTHPYVYVLVSSTAAAPWMHTTVFCWVAGTLFEIYIVCSCHSGFVYVLACEWVAHIIIRILWFLIATQSDTFASHIDLLHPDIRPFMLFMRCMRMPRKPLHVNTACSTCCTWVAHIILYFL